jgi:hypothetical protein
MRGDDYNSISVKSSNIIIFGSVYSCASSAVQPGAFSFKTRSSGVASTATISVTTRPTQRAAVNGQLHLKRRQCRQIYFPDQILLFEGAGFGHYEKGRNAAKTLFFIGFSLMDRSQTGAFQN